MTGRTAIFLISAALAAGCHGSQNMKRSDQNFQVVEEGQASGVTSTINAPGETPPPLTDTAVDTTTNFTLANNAAQLGTQPPNTVVGTLPSGTDTSYPSNPAQQASTPPPQPPMTSGATTQTTEPQSQSPTPTDTMSSQPSPPKDTTASAPPPPGKEKPKQDEKKEGEQTDTPATTTAPPPPVTPPV